MKDASSVPQCCRTCAYADYLRTPTGRPRRGESASCRFPAGGLQQQVDALIATFPDAFQHLSVRVYAHGMGVDDGQGCSGYKPAKGADDATG